ncbi:hypothetical protein Tco_0425089 [Tanacetum coccineum]
MLFIMLSWSGSKDRPLILAPGYHWAEKIKVQLLKGSLKTTERESRAEGLSPINQLYDILKQHQNEISEIRAERLACTANPLALVAQQQPVYHPQNHPIKTLNIPPQIQQSTRNRGNAIG